MGANFSLSFVGPYENRICIKFEIEKGVRDGYHESEKAYGMFGKPKNEENGILFSSCDISLILLQREKKKKKGTIISCLTL